MPLIRVDPRVLHDVGTRLTSAAQVASDVKHNRDSLKAHVADCGSSHLQGVVHEFLDEWAYGMDCMEDDARTLAQLLTSSGELYIEVETAIARGAGQ